MLNVITENLLEKNEYSGNDAILTSIIQTIGLLVLKDDVIFMVCQDPGMLGLHGYALLTVRPSIHPSIHLSVCQTNS